MVSASDIWRLFGRIEQSPLFVPYPRALELLEYLLKEEIEGRGERIKGFGIALDLWGEDTLSHPKLQQRLHADHSQLRLLLDGYFEKHEEEQLQISLPVRQYRLEIKQRPGARPRVGTEDTDTQDPPRHTIIRKAAMVAAAGLVVGLPLFLSVQLGVFNGQAAAPPPCTSEVPVVGLEAINNQQPDDAAQFLAVLDHALHQQTTIRGENLDERSGCSLLAPQLQLTAKRIGESKESLQARLSHNGKLLAEITLDPTEPLVPPRNDYIFAAQISDWLGGMNGIVPDIADDLDWPDAQARRNYRCLVLHRDLAAGQKKQIDQLDRALACADKLESADPFLKSNLLAASMEIRINQLAGLLPAQGLSEEDLRAKLIQAFLDANAVKTQSLQNYLSQFKWCLLSGHDAIQPAIQEFDRRYGNGPSEFLFTCRRLIENGLSLYYMNALVLEYTGDNQSILFGNPERGMEHYARASRIERLDTPKHGIPHYVDMMKKGDFRRLKQAWMPASPKRLNQFDLLPFLVAADQLDDRQLAIAVTKELKSLNGSETYSRARSLVEQEHLEPGNSDLFNRALVYGFESTE